MSRFNEFEGMKLARAQAFCAAAHSAVGQKRKYTGQPYYTHSLEVAGLIQDHAQGWGVDMLVAAMLHDVIEDTQVTEDRIRDYFGPVVAQLVLEVTDVSKPEDGNRAQRKALDREHLAKASPAGKTIKLADMLDNLMDFDDMLANDPSFAAIYLGELREKIKVLADGDSTLYEMVLGQLNKYATLVPATEQEASA